MNRIICTKENPWRKEDHVPGTRVAHPDARETDLDSEYRIEYRCPHCGLVFSETMPD